MKGYEGDSYLQTSTGIQRHRLRALFGRADNGNTLEQTGRTGAYPAGRSKSGTAAVKY